MFLVKVTICSHCCIKGGTLKQVAINITRENTNRSRNLCDDHGCVFGTTIKHGDKEWKPCVRKIYAGVSKEYHLKDRWNGFKATNGCGIIICTVMLSIEVDLSVP